MPFIKLLWSMVVVINFVGIMNFIITLKPEKRNTSLKGLVVCDSIFAIKERGNVMFANEFGTLLS